MTTRGTEGSSLEKMQPFEIAPRFQYMSDTWKPGSRPEHDPTNRHEHSELSTTEARQAVSGLGVRYVLAISLSAALAVFAIIYFIYAG